MRRRILSRHLIAARVVLICFVIGFLLILFIGVRFIAGKSEFIKMAGNFLFLPSNTVEVTEERINILLLGKAGKDPVLTDTMIVVSVGRDRIAMVSIPRDIWVPEFKDKINSAYSRGGLVLAKSVSEDVVGKTIHYAVAFDFEGFAKLIDILGGVEIEVERSFTDTKYPIPGKESDECGGDPEFGCRYETVHFEKGKELMNGAKALKFARSRQSTDPAEGTDLARAARQQKVLIAIKDKMALPEIFLSVTKMSALWSTFMANTETDLTSEQMAYLGRLVYDSRNSVASHTIPEELLFNPPYSEEYNNLYVFTPKAGDWREVQSWVAGIF